MQLGSKNIARLICAQDVTVSFSQEVIMVKSGSLLAIPPTGETKLKLVYQTLSDLLLSHLNTLLYNPSIFLKLFIFKILNQE